NAALSADHSIEEMLAIALMLAALAAAAASRAPSVAIAALRTDSGCSSTVSVTNLSGRELAAEIQARLESGALVPLELAEQPSATQPSSEPRSEPCGSPAGAAAVRSDPSSTSPAAE